MSGWTPCFTNEDAHAANLQDRDQLMERWCADSGGIIGREWEDCGRTGMGPDWSFRRRCDIVGTEDVPVDPNNLQPGEGYATRPQRDQQQQQGGGQAGAGAAGAGSNQGGCPPLDCYQQCQELDRQKNEHCKELNRLHVEAMKEAGCKGTKCSTKPFGKTCRKRKTKKKKKTTKRKRRTKKKGSVTIKC